VGLDNGHFDRIEVYKSSSCTSSETQGSGGVSDLDSRLKVFGTGIAVKSARQGKAV
jgi:hypothetical protein